MDSGWTVKAGKPIPKWKIGPRIWRVDGNWRLKLYRPWSYKKQIEVTCKSFKMALYILGVGAGWWKGFDGPTGSTSNQANQQSE